MDRPLVDQRRYLAALAAAAAPEPVTHRCQLAALARERALASSAADAPSYRRASGELFELARAAWLDRLVAHARVAAAHDDPWTATAMAIELDAALAARGHADWTAVLGAGSATASVWQGHAATARAAYGGLVAAVVQAAWDRRGGAQAEAAAAIAAHGPAWVALEPAAVDGDLDRVLAQPRYIAVTPWPDAGRAALTARLAAALPTTVAAPVEVAPVTATLARIEAAIARYLGALPSAGGGPIAGGEPTVADVVVPYQGLAALPGDAPALAALRGVARQMIADAVGAATPQGVLAVWTERARLAALAAAPVAAEAEAVLARCAAWPDPIRAAGARALLADLSGIRTGTDADLVSMHHGACATVEAGWTRAFAEVALAPVLATCIAGWDPAARGSVAPAWALAGAIAGVGVEVVAAPLARAVVTAIAAHRVATDDLGAYLGEIGHAIVGEARAWLGVTGQTPTSAAAVEAALAAGWGDPARRTDAAVILWGRACPLARFGPTLPPRPPVPGRSRPRPT
ncbi:MAG: hypothetical protein IPL61_02475 [Myxococcales bacterium]|nr:hypothetical protein [Myxococcales bacterium]